MKWKIFVRQCFRERGMCSEEPVHREIRQDFYIWALLSTVTGQWWVFSKVPQTRTDRMRELGLITMVTRVGKRVISIKGGPRRELALRARARVATVLFVRRAQAIPCLAKKSRTGGDAWAGVVHEEVIVIFPRSVPNFHPSALDRDINRVTFVISLLIFPRLKRHRSGTPPIEDNMNVSRECSSERQRKPCPRSCKERGTCEPPLL